jgi:hypothetical protein
MSKAPTQWTVEEVYKGDTGQILVKLSASGSYEPVEWTPNIGQTLVLKEETDGPA